MLVNDDNVRKEILSKVDIEYPASQEIIEKLETTFSSSRAMAISIDEMRDVTKDIVEQTRL